MFKLTPKQREANVLLASEAKHLLLYGGSRSGKTFLITRAITIRAAKAPGSRHAILRFRGNAVKQSIVMDTFPKVMRTCFPELDYEINMADMFARFPNNSELWFGGLDDKDRVEKILGNEYATIFLNECSQIPYASRNMALTRLAQKCYQELGGQRVPLPLKMYYDENPPDRSHWSYRLFRQKVNPDTREPLADQSNYAYMQINPQDNTENLPEDYIQTLRSMPAYMQQRFLLGEFRETNPNALFNDNVIDKWRMTNGSLPDMVRLVIAVDPSGSEDDDNANNDEIGIHVAGLGTDGVSYSLEDLTVKAGPATWGKVAVDAYHRHKADLIAGEVNFGGAMVGHVIKTADPKVNYRKLTASRGKIQRSEPISALMEQGKVRLAGYFPELEEELSGFTTSGYVGDRSPNRADAFIWAHSALFPGIIALRPETKPRRSRIVNVSSGSAAWMA